MWSVYTLVVLSAGDMRQACFAPSSSEVAVVFWYFYILLSIICLNCTHVRSFWVYSFIFVAQGDVRPGRSTSAKGSQVPSPSPS